MAEQIITEESDADLWSSLKDIYEKTNQSRDVIKAKKMYRVLWSTEGKIMFQPVSTLDYLDSRSWKPSKKTSYRKLFGDKSS